MTGPLTHRRFFVTLLGGAAAAWPLAARAQQSERVRRIGVLWAFAENVPAWQSGIAAFRAELAKLGWVEGRNLRTEVRFGSGDPARNRAHAAEFVKLACDVVVTGGTDAARAMQERTRTTPIVIVGAADVAVNGLVKNIARPESNITGFTNNYASISGKWMQLLKEAAPHVGRVLVLAGGSNAAYQRAIDEAAPAIGVRLVKVIYRNPLEIVRAIDEFAAEPNGGLLVLPANLYPDTIIPTAAQYRLPAIYPEREEVAAGGLLAYTSDSVERFRGAAGYVDRLLRGTAKVADLPVQYPIKYDLTVNLKTAKAIGLTIPEAFLLRADEVIE